MRIEHTKTVENIVGDAVAEILTDRLVVELPDPPVSKPITFTLCGEPLPTDRSSIVLWNHARDFLFNEFSYLGPHGADEMADRFMERWRRHH